MVTLSTIWAGTTSTAKCTICCATIRCDIERLNSQNMSATGCGRTEDDFDDEPVQPHEECAQPGSCQQRGNTGGDCNNSGGACQDKASTKAPGSWARAAITLGAQGSTSTSTEITNCLKCKTVKAVVGWGACQPTMCAACSCMHDSC